MDILILWILILLVITIALGLTLKKIIFYFNERNNSIKNYINCVNVSIKRSNIIIIKEYAFKRVIKYKNECIPLGKVIFDDNSKQVLIYETFIYKNTKLVCKPDIRIFNYKNLIKCSIYQNDKEVENVKKIVFNSKNNIFIKIELTHNISKYIVLRFMSVNDKDIFLTIYNEIAKIINNNKKIV